MPNCCNKREIKNIDCCNKPKNEIIKTRHYTQMSKKYFTRLEDKIKHDLKEKKCC